MKLTELRDYIENEIGDINAKVSLLVYDYTTGETPVSIDARRKLVSASTIKTPIMLTALDLVNKGVLTLTQPVPVPCEEILEDTEVLNCGQKECPLEELLTWMIINSDNTATNILIGLLGMDAVNSYCRSLGLSSTVLERKMLDWDAVAAGRNNYTSADDQRILFTKLYEKSILTPELCSLAMDILTRQRDYGSALRFLCDPQLSFAHKTGGLDYLRHDVGIFHLPARDYYFGCFVTDAADQTDENAVAERLIGRISKAVYQYCK